MMSSISRDTSVKQSLRKVFWVLGLVLFFNIFLYQRMGPVATILVFISYWIFSLGVFWNQAKVQRGVVMGVSLISTVFSFILLGFENSFARAIVILTWAAVLNFSIYLLTSEKSFFEDSEELVLAPVALMVSYISSGLRIGRSILLGEFLGEVKVNGNGKWPVRRLFSLGIGLLVGIPLVLILLGLLSSGDPVFSDFVRRIGQELGKIFSLTFWARPIGYLVFSLIMLAAFLPLGLLHLWRLPRKYLPKTVAVVTEITVVVGMVAVVLGTFLAVQWNYVFATVVKETSLAKFGVATYSEYVKRGFFEFLLVSVIVYGLLRLSMWIYAGARDQALGARRFLLIFQGLLFAEFGVFILSLFRRIYLYQQYHGWSLSRIYGGIFLLWVLGLVLILIWRFFAKRNFLIPEVLLTLGVVVFVGLFNAENFVATTHPPTVNKKTDYVYLSRLGTDGYEGWKMAYDQARDVLNRKHMGIINRDDRREIAYAGMVDRNLLGSYLQLVWEYGTKNEQDDLAKQVGAKNFNDVEVSYAEYIFFYDNDPGFKGFMVGTIIPEKFRNREKENVLDRLYSWNYSEQNAFNKMKTDMPILALLDLQHKYMENYKRISSQSESERGFDFDISLNSPFLN